MWCDQTKSWKQIQMHLYDSSVELYSSTDIPISNAVIFIGPFKISIDNYHTVDNIALCVLRQYGFAHW